MKIIKYIRNRRARNDRRLIKPWAAYVSIKWEREEKFSEILFSRENPETLLLREGMSARPYDVDWAGGGSGDVTAGGAEPY